MKWIHELVKPHIEGLLMVRLGNWVHVIDVETGERRLVLAAGGNNVHPQVARHERVPGDDEGDGEAALRTTKALREMRIFAALHELETQKLRDVRRLLGSRQAQARSFFGGG